MKPNQEKGNAPHLEVTQHLFPVQHSESAVAKVSRQVRVKQGVVFAGIRHSCQNKEAPFKAEHIQAEAFYFSPR